MSKIIVIIVIILAAAGVGVAVNNNKKSEPASSGNTSQPASTNTAQPQQAAQSGQGSTGTNFAINATDDSADVTTLNVKKGDKITVTFNVQQSGVYHGGLEFKSDVVSSGPIKPGESKTVTFTADQSFDFTPYWYQSNVQKGYLISVKVM